jgi:hypothetical protein
VLYLFLVLSDLGRHEVSYSVKTTMWRQSTQPEASTDVYRTGRAWWRSAAQHKRSVCERVLMMLMMVRVENGA